MSYPYSPREVAVDGTIHALGLTAAITGTVFLFSALLPTAPSTTLAAVSVYVGFLIFALVASAAYHMLPWEGPRPLLLRIDHAAIYFKIAGTYTPIVIFMNSVYAYALLAVVWGVALFGAWAKLRFWSTDSKGSLPLYLIMGWASVLLFPMMWEALPLNSLFLIAAGGLLYTLGTVFFSARGMRYQNAIWHAFVLAASTCLFIAISLASLS